MSEDRLDRLGPRGELVLASGRRAVLAGLHWPDTQVEAEAASAWLMRRSGRPLTISPLGGEDRWGRLTIDAVADPAGDAQAPDDLAGGLVAAGLVLVDAGEKDGLCRPDLLALEAAPRDAATGVWKARPIDARDGAALTERDGRFVVAEGRLVGIGERSARTYLDFVRRGGSGLTVTVPKRTWLKMQVRGLTAAALKGRFVRVRGVIELRGGPIIELTSPDMLEMLPEGGRTRADRDG